VDNRFLEFIGVRDPLIRKQLKTTSVVRNHSNSYQIDIEMSPKKDVETYD